MSDPGATIGSAADDLADFARALLDPAHPVPRGLRTWNGSDPRARLAVHRNNVVSSLIDALANTFPVVQQLVGTEFFRAMAGIFVRQAPPRSGVLADYGQDFPAFVTQFSPAQGLPYLADLARLEAARVRAHHAADAAPLDSPAAAQALAAGERIGELQLRLHPSVSVLVSAHAVVSLWAAHQHDGDIEPVDIDVAEAALVLRAGLDVLVLPLPPGGAAFVQAAMGGDNLSRAAAQAMQAAPPFDLAAMLRLLVGHGALTALALPQALGA